MLEGDNRAIATALLTGRRDAISERVNDAMFISLAHVLSISGYHNGASRRKTQKTQEP